jgi:light-regulated signal transduction histidine kinase (bacteriophytochrome)
MSTFAQLLQRRYGNQLDEQGAGYIEFINKGAANLNQLIEDLLTYSRVNTGDQTKAMIDVNELLEEVKKGLAKTIQESKTVFYTKNLPEKIHANAIKMKQLFQNLIANAIKFRQENQVPYIEISARDTGSHWQFKVADNGIGIKPDYQETIFLLFKKLHGMGDYEGTGLGLAICKKVVEQHQGDIWVESTPGEGSTFYFTLKK